MNEKTKSTTRPVANVPDGNVDQIRDILFGGQMRDYERRFDELDERLKRDAERMRSDLLKRVENLEVLLKDQHDKLGAQLNRLDADLKAANEQHASQSEKLARAFRAELSELDDKHEQSGSTLRERVHKLANETADALRASHEELGHSLERLGTGLRDEKVARDELAGFFTEMALRLTRQFDLPKVAKP